MLRVGLVNGDKCVTLNKRANASVSIKGMALHVLEVVVDRMKVAVDSILTKFGGATGYVVEVVLVQSELLSLSNHHHCPVMIAVTGSGGVGNTGKSVAYVQYVAKKDKLCNSIMILAELDRLGTAADKVLLYPH